MQTMRPIEVYMLDDEETQRKVFKALFAKKHLRNTFEVHVFKDRASIMEAVKASGPKAEVLFLDVRMEETEPDLDGIDIGQEVRKHLPMAIPVVATAHPNVDRAGKAVDLQARRFLNRNTQLPMDSIRVVREASLEVVLGPAQARFRQAINDLLTHEGRGVSHEHFLRHHVLDVVPRLLGCDEVALLTRARPEVQITPEDCMTIRVAEVDRFLDALAGLGTDFSAEVNEDRVLLLHDDLPAVPLPAPLLPRSRAAVVVQIKYEATECALLLGWHDREEDVGAWWASRAAANEESKSRCRAAIASQRKRLAAALHHWLGQAMDDVSRAASHLDHHRDSRIRAASVHASHVESLELVFNEASEEVSTFLDLLAASDDSESMDLALEQARVMQEKLNDCPRLFREVMPVPKSGNEPQQVPLNRLIERVVENYSADLQARHGVELSTRGELASVLTFGWPGLLEDALLRIVGAALACINEREGSEETKRRISLGIERRDDWEILYVEDTGVPIDRDYRGVVFKPKGLGVINFFRQQQKDTDRSVKGYSLWRARWIIHGLHEGEVDVSAARGHDGNRFEVRLPGLATLLPI